MRDWPTRRHALIVAFVQKVKHHPQKGIKPRTFYHAEGLDAPQPVGSLGDDGRPVPEAEANLVSSLTESGQHAPLIDLDVPARLVPSTTPGHTHLYVDVEMPWWRYIILLTGLVLSGVIGTGYYVHSLRRRMTMLRKPEVKKPYQDPY